MPVLCGSTTHCVAAAAIAASAALPPERNTSRAVRVARGCDVAAIPFAAIAADRPGTLKSRIVPFPGPRTWLHQRNPSPRVCRLPGTNAPSYPSGQFANREEEHIMDGSLTGPLHFPVAAPP